MVDGESGEPKRDWARALDLNRTQLTKDLVDQLEDALRRQQVAADDVKAICASAKEQEYRPFEVAAMKAVARLRLQDKGPEAKEKLQALEKVCRAVEFDLFE
jgi:uncharacterized protein (UPF0335 family)